MSNQRWLRSGLFSVTALAMAATACSKMDQSSKTEAKATQQGKAAGTPGGLAPLPMYLEDLVADPTAFATYVSTVETATPRQNPHPVNIKKDPSVSCTGPKAKLTFQTYATAGEYSRTDLTSGDNTTDFGHAVGTVNNETACVPISIPLPGQSSADAGAAIVFIAAEKGTNAYKLFVVDSTTRVILKKYDFADCDPGHAHPWYGDHSVARKYKDKCDHSKPSPAMVVQAGNTKKDKASDALPAGGDIDDAWTLWISCGADCCYADTGGTKGDGDSTHTDTTHRDTTHGDSGKKAAKKA